MLWRWCGSQPLRKPQPLQGAEPGRGAQARRQLHAKGKAAVTMAMGWGGNCPEATHWPLLEVPYAWAW